MFVVVVRTQPPLWGQITVHGPFDVEESARSYAQATALELSQRGTASSVSVFPVVVPKGT